MAYRCGYVDGYDDTCVPEEGSFCGGGYAAVQYAAAPYGGALPCRSFVPNPSTNIQSNVEEYCVLDYVCGQIRRLD